MESISQKLTELETKIQDVTSEIFADVFRGARETRGSERLKYIRRLKTFGSQIGPQNYAELLRNLMTNEATINELERKGRKELAEETKGKIKKFFVK